MVLGAAAWMADYAHFTWWALTLYGVFLVAWALGAGRFVWVYMLVVQLLVLFGVWVMSATGCTTLTETCAETGPVVYAVGNFAMHYWPALGIVLRSSRPWRFENQCWSATATFLVYCAAARPNAVYGCPVAYNTVVAAGYAGGVITTGMIASHEHVVRGWRDD